MQAIHQHQLKDSKRRQLELEDQVKEQKQQIDDLLIQNQKLQMTEKPTRESDTEEINKDQVIQNLEDEVVQKQLEIEEISEKNMET